jgi:hypothetical protein
MESLIDGVFHYSLELIPIALLPCFALKSIALHALLGQPELVTL